MLTPREREFRQRKAIGPRVQPISRRHRNCLAAIRGGTATVGVSLADIVAEVGRFDPDLTEREALQCVGDLLLANLARKSALDPNRYVITPKGIEVIES